MNLRPYQTAAIDQLREHIRAGARRLLLVAPCGAGKTVIAAEMIRSARARNRFMLFVSHTREITDQTAAKLDAIGASYGVMMGQDHRTRPGEPIQIATVQTLHRRDLPYADVIFVDEAHRARAASYQAIFERYPRAVVIGLTATPWRHDGRGLGEMFQESVVAATPRELVDAGYLVPVTGFSYDNPDLSGVRVKRTGDYDDAQLGAVMRRTTLMGNVVDKWRTRAAGLRTLAFAVHVEHSRELVQMFRDAGIPAEHVDGETPKEQRAAAVARLRRREVLVLSNVNVFSEGLDVPEAECLALARPTQSLTCYIQQVGRGRRPLPGKLVCRIHDHAGVVHHHGLPDADRDYTLEADLRATSQRETVSPLRTCEKCLAVYEPRLQACPLCGHVNPPKVSKVRYVEATERPLEELQAIRRDRDGATKQADYYAEKKAEAIRRGYKPGWAKVQYRYKYGTWPRESA